jgi:hypothetical protein
LTGTWYVNGDRDERTEIVSTPSGLEASRTFSTHRSNRQFFEGRGLQGCVNTRETILNRL